MAAALLAFYHATLPLGHSVRLDSRIHLNRTMNTLKRTFTLLLVSFFWVGAMAQSSHWMPIPHGQTSYFQDRNGEIFPMETDWWYPGGAGDFYGIYELYMDTQYDSCADLMWDPEYYGLAKADFRMYVDQFDQVMIQTAAYETYFIPLQTQPGDWAAFGTNLIIRLDSQEVISVLGSNDSVRFYTIYAADSLSELGDLALSKSNGLVQYTPLKHYKSGWPSDPDLWTLIGKKDAQGSAGFALPEKEDFMPYTVGDEVVFYHSYWTSGQNTTEKREYHHLMIDAIETDLGMAGISGMCMIYDYQGFYLRTDSSYTLSFDPMLEELTDHQRCMPLSSLAEGVSWPMQANVAWTEVANGEITARMNAFSYITCDTNVVVDGPNRTEVYSDKVGVVDIHLNGFRPPTRWILQAADLSATGMYGDWPQWLGQVELNVEPSLRIFPNPASEVLVLESVVATSTDVELWTPLGQHVLSTQVNGRVEMDVSHLEAGCYFVRYNVDGRLVTKSIVLQH